MRAGMAGRGGRDLFCQQSALASRDYQCPVSQEKYFFKKYVSSVQACDGSVVVKISSFTSRTGSS